MYSMYLNAHPTELHSDQLTELYSDQTQVLSIEGKHYIQLEDGKLAEIMYNPQDYPDGTHDATVQPTQTTDGQLIDFAATVEVDGTHDVMMQSKQPTDGHVIDFAATIPDGGTHDAIVQPTQPTDFTAAVNLRLEAIEAKVEKILSFMYNFEKLMKPTQSQSQSSQIETSGNIPNKINKLIHLNAANFYKILNNSLVLIRFVCFFRT